MKITTYMAIFQIICDVHSTNLRIFLFVESNKNEHLVYTDNHIYYINNIFYTFVEVK